MQLECTPAATESVIMLLLCSLKTTLFVPGIGNLPEYLLASPITRATSGNMLFFEASESTTPAEDVRGPPWVVNGCEHGLHASQDMIDAQPMCRQVCPIQLLWIGGRLEVLAFLLHCILQVKHCVLLSSMYGCVIPRGCVVYEKEFKFTVNL